MYMFFDLLDKAHTSYYFMQLPQLRRIKALQPVQKRVVEGKLYIYVPCFQALQDKAYSFNILCSYKYCTERIGIYTAYLLSLFPTRL